MNVYLSVCYEAFLKLNFINLYANANHSQVVVLKGIFEGWTWGIGGYMVSLYLCPIKSSKWYVNLLPYSASKSHIEEA